MLSETRLTHGRVYCQSRIHVAAHLNDSTKPTSIGTMEAAVKMAFARKKRLGALVMLSRMKISSDILRDRLTLSRSSSTSTALKPTRDGSQPHVFNSRRRGDGMMMAWAALRPTLSRSSATSTALKPSRDGSQLCRTLLDEMLALTISNMRRAMCYKHISSRTLQSRQKHLTRGTSYHHDLIS